jgi:hypothetical protein
MKYSIYYFYYSPTEPLEPGKAVESSAVMRASGIAHTNSNVKPDNNSKNNNSKNKKY